MHAPQMRNSEWHHIKATYAVGCLVEAIVLRHVGLGLLCAVGSEQVHAVLRKSEIDWDPNQQTNSTLPEGASFRAIIIGFDEPRQQLILSRKAADSTPFVRFCTTQAVGDIVDATAQTKNPSHWVVRLPGGISARLPNDEIPEVPTCPGELTIQPQLTPGDRLWVCIQGIDEVTQEITVSVRSCLARMQRENWSTLMERGSKYAREQRSSGRAHVTFIPAGRNAVRSLRILLVDDKEEILYCLSSSLKDRSHLVSVAENWVQAKLWLDSATDLDVAIVDFQLSGQSAVGLLRRLRAQFPDIRLIIFTADIAGARSIAKVHNAILVQKPTPPADVIAFIEGYRKPDFLRDNLDEMVESLSERNEKNTNADSDLKAILDNHLGAIQELMPKAALAVLRLQHSSNQVVCLTALNIDKREFELFRSRLRFSFVGDVLQERNFGQFHRNPWAGITDSLTELMSELGTDRVLGARIDAHAISDPFGVFAFYSCHATSIDSHATREFHQQVRAIGLELDRKAIVAGIARHQHTLSAANMLLGTTHELKNCVQTLQFQTFNLVRSLECSDREPLDRISGGIDFGKRLTRQIDDLNIVFESLLGMSRMVSGDNRPVGELVLQVIRQCQPTAEQSSILLWAEVDVTTADSLHLIPANLGQVILNLVLNAIQHTHTSRPENGFVCVTTELELSDNCHWLVIRVHDNAFGIDAINLARIFQMFETTRRNGSGLGLYVSRMIVTALGGQIFVEASHKFFGSTFVVRIPVGQW